MGRRRSTVGYRVAVRAAEVLALLAAAGGALAVSRQLEHRLTPNSGPLAGLHDLQAAPSPPSVVFAAAAPAQASARRQRGTLPTVLSGHTGPAAATLAPEAPGLSQPRSSAPDDTAPGQGQTPPSPPAAPAPPPAAPAPPPAAPPPPPAAPPPPPAAPPPQPTAPPPQPTAPPPQPTAPPPQPTAPPPAPPIPVATLEPSPPRASTAASSQPSNAPSQPAAKSLTEQPTCPGWGRGDKNHVHTGPPGAPANTTPPASPLANPATPTGVQDTSTPSDAQAHQTVNGPNADPPGPHAPEPGVPPAAVPAPDSGTDHGNHSGNAGHKH